MAYIIVPRQTYLYATLAGNQLSTALETRIRHGFDRRYAEADLVLGSFPDAGYDNATVIDVGAGGNGGANNATRFTGVNKQYDFDLYPSLCTLRCYGKLYRAQEYECPDAGGRDLSGGGGGVADEDMVKALLTAAGVTYTGTDIAGTGQLLGALGTFDVDDFGHPTGPFTWPEGDPALGMIGRIDEVSIHSDQQRAFMTYEDFLGNPRRAAVGGRPRTTEDWVFTEGVDIFKANSSRTILTTRNYARVTGFDLGYGIGPWTSTIQTSNPYQPNTEKHTTSFSSPMLERQTEGVDGKGISTDRLGNYLLSRDNNERVLLQMTTRRDDLVKPGQTILVQGANRLGISNERMWVMGIEIVRSRRAGFYQTFSLITGGTDYTDPAPPFS